MSLYNLIAAGHNGQCFALLARRFMISEPQAARAVQFLIPALLPSFESWLSAPGGVAAYLQLLSRGNYQQALASPTIFSNHFERDRGVHLLETFRAAREIDGADFARAVEGSGVSYRVLSQMAPFVALLMIGALRIKTEAPLRQILGRRLGGRLRPSADIFGDLAEIVVLDAKGPSYGPLSSLLSGLLNRASERIAGDPHPA